MNEDEDEYKYEDDCSAPLRAKFTGLPHTPSLTPEEGHLPAMGSGPRWFTLYLRLNDQETRCLRIRSSSSRRARRLRAQDRGGRPTACSVSGWASSCGPNTYGHACAGEEDGGASEAEPVVDDGRQSVRPELT